MYVCVFASMEDVSRWVCVSLCMYVYIPCMHTYECKHGYMYARLHICMHVYMNVCKYSRTSLHLKCTCTCNVHSYRSMIIYTMHRIFTYDVPSCAYKHIDDRVQCK